MDSSEEESIDELSNSSIDMSREDMCNIIKECDRKGIAQKLDYLEKKLIEKTKCPENKIKLLRRNLKTFRHEFTKKLKSACYKEDRFESCTRNKQWLNGTIALPVWRPSRSSSSGRPSKRFAECSERSKRRRTEHLRSELPHAELTYAAGMSERAAGNNDLCLIIKNASATPTRASKYRKIINSAENCKTEKLSPTEALSKYVEADLTRRQYNIIRAGQENIYPCYSLLQIEKKKCYPKEILISETMAEVKLQNLLDHIIQRLCLYLKDVLEPASELEKQNMKLICKWGCDGSKQREYNQKFENKSDSDSHVFISSLVPLRLISDINGRQKIWWQNPVPSSPRFCSPIRIQFVRESNDVTLAEISHIETQAQNLDKTEVTANDTLIKVKHILLPTMVDGKVCNAATSTSSTMRCYICKRTSKDFNKLNASDESTVDPDTLKFGLSILHARIRFFESILHLAYKLPVKKWRVNDKKEQLICEVRKKEIQEAFRNEMGLLVDIPKAGIGNTNDGNTSRRFFSQPEKAANITGIDVHLIKKLGLILEVLSSGFPVNTAKFSEFLQTTAKYYVELYNWYPMTPTLHKIFAHGALIIKHALLPIGQLSEEAAESRNKHFRKFRESYSRKFTRKQCLEDTLNRLLLTSDVFLSCSRKKEHRMRKSFSKEALEFLEQDVNTGDFQEIDIIDGANDSRYDSD